MPKLFFIEDEHIKLMNELMKRRIDNEYIVLNSNNQLCDIAQYSCKYMNIHIATVPTEKLDSRYRLA